jgi:hypothetical protein
LVKDWKNGLAFGMLAYKSMKDKIKVAFKG